MSSDVRVQVPSPAHYVFRYLALVRFIYGKTIPRKNQLVDVLVSDGALNITMKGLALGTAGAGEMVSVRNPDSRKDFQAKVVGINTVQVKF